MNIENLWAVGDKAVCTWKKPANDGLEVGKIYTVSGVYTEHCGPTDALVLQLAELPSFCSCGCSGEGGWFADRFRKVQPDKHEAEEECPQLLKLLKNKEKVDA